MSPFQIALTLGYRVHKTRGRTLRGRWGCTPFWPKRSKMAYNVVPPVFGLRNPSRGDAQDFNFPTQHVRMSYLPH